MNVVYAGGVFGPTDPYPATGLPEVAIVGRSNVGKSSLINMMLDRKQMARVSSTPGRTQALHFFTVVAPHRVCLVDLPGYGFAEAPAAIRKAWPKLVYGYLENAPELTLGLLLVDIRREIREEEHALAARFAARNVPLILVVTKADKEAKTRRQAGAQRLATALGVPFERAIAMSTLTREGRDELWRAIDRLAVSKTSGPPPKPRRTPAAPK